MVFEIIFLVNHSNFWVHVRKEINNEKGLIHFGSALSLIMLLIMFANILNRNAPGSVGFESRFLSQEILSPKTVKTTNLQVWNARKLGAAAVLVADDRNELLNTMALLKTAILQCPMWRILQFHRH
ncbi:hypothetical protein O6H91_11G084500 [Diphasiastrum complanatum]|uniref:Uncharacterized protein n=1 Tax=Diphasiastrum complanatum TaxID=34168 RepID=A0ACC2CBE4_DIPCM|nr:hypothetical protein O6H91_11G084500 [Diphasiastrum complanatum]